MTERRAARPDQSQVKGWALLAIGMLLSLVSACCGVMGMWRWQLIKDSDPALAYDLSPLWWDAVVAVSALVGASAVVRTGYLIDQRRPLPWLRMGEALTLFLTIDCTFVWISWMSHDGGASVPWWDKFIVLPATAVASVDLFRLGRALGVVGRQHLVEVVNSPQELDVDSYVLYLRSFDDDVRRASLEENQHHPPGPGAVLPDLFLSDRTDEEQLAAALASVAPLVAVGRPGERLPLLGARRLYLPLDDWQDTVRQLMERARLVVMVLGMGPGLMWEFIEAVRILPPERLVLMVSMDEPTYEQFCSLAHEQLRDLASTPLMTTDHPLRPEQLLPPLPRAGKDADTEDSAAFRGAIYFDHDWTANVVLFDTARARRRYGGRTRVTLKKGLRPALDRVRPRANGTPGVGKVQGDGQA
ncbi:hypothetical protein OG535_40020 [Kitasatospora sp. NBC_00085]|uniref:hypothetical protein n=1 Tax=unclassified Kitasatospora TaxID=2633591 RepID=UPI003247981E